MARRRLSGFVCTTLRRARKSLRPIAKSRPAPALAPLKLLVIDDDSQVGFALKRMLRRHDVTYVQDGESALQALEAATYDVVISDIMMPQVSGMDVYRRLQATGSGLVDRFIFVTGGGHSDAARAFLAEVPNERFDKPVDRAQLEAAIARVASRPPPDDVIDAS